MARSLSSSSKRRAVALALALCLGTATLVWADHPLLDFFVPITLPAGAAACPVAGGVTTFTWSHTVGPGTNRELFIIIYSAEDGTMGTMTNPSWSLGVVGGVNVNDNLAGGTSAAFARVFSFLTPTSGTGTILVQRLVPTNHYAFLSISLTGQTPLFELHNAQSPVNLTAFTLTFAPTAPFGLTEDHASHLDVTTSGNQTVPLPGLSAPGPGQQVLLNTAVCGLITKQAASSFAGPIVSPFTWTNTVSVNQWVTETYSLLNKPPTVGGPTAGGAMQHLPLQGVGQ